MSELYTRVLLWHKLVAMQTGGLALCSARHRLNRDEARIWIDTLRNVADDMTQFLLDGTFILDSKGQRVVQSAGEGASPETAREVQHVATHAKPHSGTDPRATDRKVGGPRVANRRAK